jgi:dynein heavy chain
MTAILNEHIAAGRAVDKQGFERLFIYCMAWSFGGLFEQDDREKFHKFLDSKGAPLPPISPQKLQVDHETVFDYFVHEQTFQWTLW